MNSKQPARYIKARMGNDLKQKILVQNGIILETEVKPLPTVSECARCQLVNPLENKYCSTCGYPLSVTAYEGLKATDDEELNKVKMQLQELKAGLSELGYLRDDFNGMKQLFDHLSKESQKHLVNDFYQKVGDKADIEWSCD